MIYGNTCLGKNIDRIRIDTENSNSTTVIIELPVSTEEKNDLQRLSDISNQKSLRNMLISILNKPNDRSCISKKEGIIVS